MQENFNPYGLPGGGAPVVSCLATSLSNQLEALFSVCLSETFSVLEGSLCILLSIENDTINMFFFSCDRMFFVQIFAPGFYYFK